MNQNMHPRVAIAFFISPHGFGHASRAAAVINAMSEKWPFVHVHLFTTVPAWFFENTLCAAFSYHEFSADIGTVQRSPLAVDLEATIGRLDETYPMNDRELDALAEKLQALECRLVVSDISPWGIAAANRAEIPSILIENFTWDWIYEAYAPHAPQLKPHICKGADAAADYICRELVCRHELLEVVDRQGTVCGAAPRCEIHGNRDWLHQVVHVLVFDDRGRLLLQKRSLEKTVAPGKWDTSVGGHVDCGESIEYAMQREMAEELGIRGATPEFAYQYIHANDFESELVFTYICRFNGEICFNPDEIDSAAFWAIPEISANLGKGLFSDNFEHEFALYRKWAERSG
ncbi:MAG: NUDIX domain-containing protein [Desulfobacterales bacterium]|nr:NUDIX domain-containing protein [Desulfobacterales bacterium]